jgi:hypothetical protein
LHKFGKAVVNYELALSIFEDSLIWMSGPYPAGKNDISVFHEGGLKNKIPAGMKGVANNGYLGEKLVLAMSNKLDTKEVKDFKQRARAHHETFNIQWHDSVTTSTNTKWLSKPWQWSANTKWKTILLCLLFSVILENHVIVIKMYCISKIYFYQSAQEKTIN